jgi:hypothetical protein
MSRKKGIIWGLVALIILIAFSQALALKEETHRAINKDIAERTISGCSFDEYLKSSLGITAGYKQKLVALDAGGKNIEQSIEEWLGYGGEQEDRPGSLWDYVKGKPSRSNNHFHNPLRLWDEDEAGLDDTVLGMHYTGQSQVLWGQNTTQNLGGNWSWQDARRYFYIALAGRNLDGTEVAETSANKNAYYAYTFRAVGQLMHLVGDASVPAHVRNNAHPEDSLGIGYESAVEKFRTETRYGTLWNDLLSSPITFDKSILDIPSTYPSATVPISRIVDTDKYSGDNPDITRTANGTPQVIGLAEYTNANFLSNGTMFETDSAHDFYYPHTTDTTLWTDNNNRTYLRKSRSGDLVNHLAVTSWLYFYRLRYFPQYAQYLPVGLDTECYKDYASFLIPRAVGYSAGLLNYFFRGKIEITPPAQYIYSITDGSKTYPVSYTDENGNSRVSQEQLFTRIKVKLRNATPGEAMQTGTLIAVAKYRKRTDYQSDLSTDPPSTWDQIGDEYSYSVSDKRDIAALSSTEAQEFAFEFTDNNAIPAGITDLSLQIVFKGTLGNEKDNAVAVGWKDLLEPTHHVFWNLTDRFSILDPSDSQFHLKTGDEIRADAELLAIVNEPPKAIIDPYDTSFEIAYTGPSSAVSAVPSAYATLHPGNYIRLILLVEKRSDTNDFNDSRVHYVKFINRNTIETGSTSSIAKFLGSYNQDTLTDNGMKFYYTNTQTFRTITDHFHSGVMRCRPYPVEQATGKHECPYNDAEVTTPPGLAPIQANILY